MSVLSTSLYTSLSACKFLVPCQLQKSSTSAFVISQFFLQIYFLDTQVWYTVISAFLGGIEGARDKLGEVSCLLLGINASHEMIPAT